MMMVSFWGYVRRALVKTRVISNPLVDASSRGELQAVEKFLAEGADPDSPGPDGRTALIVAAREGHLEVVKALIRRGASLNSKAPRNITALMTCCREGKYEIAKALIEAGAEISGQNDFGYSALGWAAKWEKTDAVVLLAAHGASSDEQDIDGVSPIQWAYRHGDATMIGALVDSGAKAGGEGLNLFMRQAARDGRLDLLELGLRAGVDPLSPGPLGVTVLHVAAQYDRSDVIQFFAARRVCLDAVDAYGVTPLMTAALAGSENAAWALLDNGADAVKQEANGLNASDLACLNGHKALAQSIGGIHGPAPYSGRTFA